MNVWYAILVIFYLPLMVIVSPSVYANQSKNWVKVGEGNIKIGTAESFVDMNDIKHINSEMVSFKFVTNVSPINASHSLTVHINCKNKLYNIVDDRIYSGTFGTGETSESIIHGKDFMVIKGSPLESVAKLVCDNQIL